MPTVRTITDLLMSHPDVDKIEFKPAYFRHPVSNYSEPPVSSALLEIVGGEGKPVVATMFGSQTSPGQPAGAHSIVLVKEENQQFVFKNSYGPSLGKDPWIRIPTNRPPGSVRNGFNFTNKITQKMSKKYNLFKNPLVGTFPWSKLKFSFFFNNF